MLRSPRTSRDRVDLAHLASSLSGVSQRNSLNCVTAQRNLISSTGRTPFLTRPGQSHGVWSAQAVSISATRPRGPIDLQSSRPAAALLVAANRQHCRERVLCARAGHPRAVGKARQEPTLPEQGRTRRRPALPPLRASQRIGGIIGGSAGDAHQRESAQRKPTGRVSIIGTHHRRRRPTRALARERTAAEHATSPCRSARWRSRLADSS